MSRIAAASSVAILVLLFACGDRERATARELRVAIEQYRQTGSPADQARVESLLARLDADIAALRAEAATADDAERAAVNQRLAALEAERADLLREWTEARLARAGDAARNAIEAVGDAVGRGLEDAGRSIRAAARGTGAPSDR